MDILTFAGFKCQALYSKGKGGTPIVFLHGLTYDIGVWQRIKILDALQEKQIPFLALDMPYGAKSQCEPKTHDPKANIALLSEAIRSLFGGEAPVLVGASLGGYIALHYAAKYPVKGMLLVAPAYAFRDNDIVLKYMSFHFPVRVIWATTTPSSPAKRCGYSSISSPTQNYLATITRRTRPIRISRNGSKLTCLSSMRKQPRKAPYHSHQVMA